MIGPFEFSKNVSEIQKSILRSIAPTFTPSVIRNIVVPLLTPSSKKKKRACKLKSTLRTLEWCCINYSKEFPNKCRIDLKNDTNEESKSVVNIFTEYNLMLRESNGKSNFDPFKRGRQFVNIRLKDTPENNYATIMINNEETVLKTTVAQLNFIHWCFTRKIIDFCNANINAIEKHELQLRKSKNKASYGKISSSLSPRKRVKKRTQLIRMPTKIISVRKVSKRLVLGAPQSLQDRIASFEKEHQ